MKDVENVIGEFSLPRHGQQPLDLLFDLLRYDIASRSACRAALAGNGVGIEIAGVIGRDGHGIETGDGNGHAARGRGTALNETNRQRGTDTRHPHDGFGGGRLRCVGDMVCVNQQASRDRSSAACGAGQGLQVVVVQRSARD